MPTASTTPPSSPPTSCRPAASATSTAASPTIPHPSHSRMGCAQSSCFVAAHLDGSAWLLTGLAAAVDRAHLQGPRGASAAVQRDADRRRLRRDLARAVREEDQHAADARSGRLRGRGGVRQSKRLLPGNLPLRMQLPHGHISRRDSIHADRPARESCPTPPSAFVCACRCWAACARGVCGDHAAARSHKIFSQDLLTIEARCHQKPWCNVTYEDGSREEIRRRERPQWVLGPDGLPTHLMTGVLPAADSHEGQVWTMAAPLL